MAVAYAAALARTPASRPTAPRPGPARRSATHHGRIGSQTDNPLRAAEKLAAALAQTGAEVRLQNAARRWSSTWGVSAASSVGTRLVAHGLPADTPIAIIENGSLPAQRVLTGTLARLGDLVREQAVASPALLIVGEVAALAGHLHWFGAPPIADVTATAALRRAA